MEMTGKRERICETTREGEIGKGVSGEDAMPPRRVLSDRKCVENIQAKQDADREA